MTEDKYVASQALTWTHWIQMAIFKRSQAVQMYITVWAALLQRILTALM